MDCKCVLFCNKYLLYDFLHYAIFCIRKKQWKQNKHKVLPNTKKKEKKLIHGFVIYETNEHEYLACRAHYVYKQ